jgi:quercetin dioxygenase-like cupin family protein
VARPWEDIVRRNKWHVAAAALVCAAISFVSPASAQQLVVKPVVEKKVRQLPAGPLYWRVENLPTLAQAQAAEGPTSLAAEVAGNVWLFTLGPPGGSTAGATKVAEVGPVPPLSAPEYLLRINQSSGPPGARTAQHTHPGSESFYVLAGRLGQRTPEGDHQVDAGKTMTGKGADTPMEVYSAGSTGLLALVMFVVDASKPFSSHASIK